MKLRLGALLCLAAISCGRAPASAPARPRPGGMAIATWSWRPESIADAGERSALLKFAEQQGVSSVYVQLAPEYERPEQLAPLIAFARAAAREGMQLIWVAGQPDWALASGHARALAAVARAERVGRRLTAAGAIAPHAMLFDVEPYLLPAWKIEHAPVLADFQQLTAALHERCAHAGLELWLTLPYWFLGEIPDASRQWLLNADGLVIMAYRNSADAVERAAREVLLETASAPRPLIIAIETKCIEPAYVSFCGRAPGEFAHVVDDLRARFAGVSAIRGLAIHEYRAWRALSNRSR
jgi:hypothetical protein